MKRYIFVLLILMLTGILSGCGGNPPAESGSSGISAAKSVESQETAGTTKTLVVYFSHSGNTKILADYIVEQVGGDMFEIKTVTAYPSDYDTVVNQAKKEQSDNIRPELSTAVENLDDYDTVFIGYPIWWGDMPMAVYSFLDTYDLSGKKILPFCTHGGSGLSGTVASIQSAEADTTVASGLAIRDSGVSDSKEDVVEWLKSVTAKSGTALF